MPGDKVGKIYYRETMNSPDILLFDPLSFKEGKTLSVESFIPSYDGKKLLIGYSESGAEISILRFWI
jgi:prolyl oligopeptidase